MQKRRGLKGFLMDYPQWGNSTLNEIKPSVDKIQKKESIGINSPQTKALAVDDEIDSFWEDEEAFGFEMEKRIWEKENQGWALEEDDFEDEWEDIPEEQGYEEETEELDFEAEAFGEDFEIEPFEPLELREEEPSAAQQDRSPSEAISFMVTDSEEEVEDKTQMLQPDSEASNAFNFEEADSLLEKETYAQQTQKEVDDFERKLQHVLSGRVPQEYAEKLAAEQDQQSSINDEISATNEVPEPVNDPSHPHAFFHQLSKARAHKKVMDMGTFKAQMEQLNDFDRIIAEQKSQSGPHWEMGEQQGGMPDIEIPKTVEMTNMELVEDLAEMDVNPENQESNEDHMVDELSHTDIHSEAFTEAEVLEPEPSELEEEDSQALEAVGGGNEIAFDDLNTAS